MADVGARPATVHGRGRRADDMRGQDTVRALVNAEWAQARALARERMTVVGTAEYAKAHAAVLELGEEMRVLERTLCERPWTET